MAPSVRRSASVISPRDSTSPTPSSNSGAECARSNEINARPLPIGPSCTPAIRFRAFTGVTMITA